MADRKDPAALESEILSWLSGSRLAASSLELLSGGSANFSYRARLIEPLEDGTSTVIVKHGEGYMALHPQNKIGIERCTVEYECLQAVHGMSVHSDPASAVRYIVRSPECYLYDGSVCTQVQEYLPEAINLKLYALKWFPSPTPEDMRPRCHQLGRLLAQWITKFHGIAEPTLRTSLEKNREMQALRHMTYYDWLLERVDHFPDILLESKAVFEKVKEKAMSELQSNTQSLVPLHGDFWTGNILLQDAQIQTEKETPVFVVDWEMAQIGVPQLDYGEMIGEIYLLWLYKKIDAGLWMVQGFADGLGEQTITSAWRTVLQVGVHLLTFGTIAPGWGTPDQVRDIARRGRDIILHASQKDRKFFEGDELAVLFS